MLVEHGVRRVVDLRNDEERGVPMQIAAWQRDDDPRPARLLRGSRVLECLGERSAVRHTAPLSDLISSAFRSVVWLSSGRSPALSLAASPFTA
ncbi:MAG: hypothetical protein ACR2HD_07385 [Solirubrobacteraceae bacterium]